MSQADEDAGVWADEEGDRAAAFARKIENIKKIGMQVQRCGDRVFFAMRHELVPDSLEGFTAPDRPGHPNPWKEIT